MLIFVTCLLQTLVSLGALEQSDDAQLEISRPELTVAGIGSALGTFREGLNDLCKGTMASIFMAGKAVFKGT